MMENGKEEVKEIVRLQPDELTERLLKAKEVLDVKSPLEKYDTKDDPDDDDKQVAFAVGDLTDDKTVEDAVTVGKVQEKTAQKTDEKHFADTKEQDILVNTNNNKEDVKQHGQGNDSQFERN